MPTTRSSAGSEVLNAGQTEGQAQGSYLELFRLVSNNPLLEDRVQIGTGREYEIARLEGAGVVDRRRDGHALRRV